MFFRDSLDEREDHIKKQLRLEEEEAPHQDIDNDPVVGLIFDAYLQIERSRKYADGGFPLPLSSSDIAAFLSCQNMPIPAREFVASIFAIDDVWLEKRYKRMSKEEKS